MAPSRATDSCRSEFASSCNWQRNLSFVDPPSRVGKGLIDVLRFEIGIRFENLVSRSTDCEQSHDGSNCHSQSANAGLSAHDGRIERDACQFFHRLTAFQEDISSHGTAACQNRQYDIPGAGSPIQRIRYADNETNYCATCQTEGKVLADRSLSRLLKQDWPRRIEEWE